MSKGYCVRSGCSELVDYGSIEVVGEGFACSVECAKAVEELAAESD